MLSQTGKPKISQRVVVTGASGFIGSHVLNFLRQTGFDVTGVSRSRSSGLHQLSSYEDAPEGDVLIHLAECNDRRMIESLGERYRSGTLKTLGALLDKNYSRFVYVSSAAVYGDRATTPRTETDPVNSDSPYSRLKLEFESAVLSRAKGEGVVARLANVYGPGLSSASVLSRILEQLPGTDPIEIASLSPVRDFVWVGDVAEALSRLSVSGASGIFNVGSGNGVSVGELFSNVLSVAGQSDRTVVESGEPALAGVAHSHLVVNVEKIKNEIGWQPKMELAKGLKRLLQLRFQQG